MSEIGDSRFSRRQVVRGGVLATLGTMLTGPLRSADVASLPLITRKIPSTGEVIPVMGIGTNAFRDSNYAQLRDVLGRMHELGGTIIDTAAMYGDSEAVIGKALAELGIRNRMFVATKFNAEGAGRSMGPPPGGPGGLKGNPRTARI